MINHNLQSEKWDKVASQVHFTLEPDLDSFQQFVPKASKILDYGCGYGRLSLALLGLGYSNLTGYDTSTNIIQRGLAEAPHLSLHSYHSTCIPEPDASFDAVICCAVMTCLPDIVTRQQSIHDIARLLRTGGIIYMTEFMRSETRQYDRDGLFTSSLNIGMKHFQEYEILELMRGFSILKTSKTIGKSLSGEPIPSFHFWGTKC